MESIGSAIHATIDKRQETKKFNWAYYSFVFDPTFAYSPIDSRDLCRMFETSSVDSGQLHKQVEYFFLSLLLSSLSRAILVTVDKPFATKKKKKSCATPI